MRVSIPIFQISLSDYCVASPPDYYSLGSRLDCFVVSHFPPGTKAAIRGIDLADHPGHSRSSLVETIVRSGTDRYDPERLSIHHDYYDPLGVHLHAVPCEITEQLKGLWDADYVEAESFFGEFIRDFFESALAERGKSLRLDVLLVYDLDQLRRVPKDATMSFSFKDPDNKPQALLGVIDVLS